MILIRLLYLFSLRKGSYHSVITSWKSEQEPARVAECDLNQALQVISKGSSFYVGEAKKFEENIPGNTEHLSELYLDFQQSRTLLKHLKHTSYAMLSSGIP